MPVLSLTIDAAIELAADPAAGPRIAAFAMREVATARATIDSVAADPPDDVDQLAAAVDSLATATEPLARLSATVSYWSPREMAVVWERIWPALLAKHAGAHTHGLTAELTAYPACLAAYAFGVGAAVAARYDRLAALLTSPVPSVNRPWQPLIEVVSPYLLGDHAVHLLGAANRIWPFSDHLYSVLRPWFAGIVPDDDDFARQFDRFETLSALARYWMNGVNRPDAWVYLGRLRRHGRYRQDATVTLLAERGRDPATQMLQSLGCPGGEIATTLEGFHAGARTVLAKVVFG